MSENGQQDNLPGSSIEEIVDRKNWKAMVQIIGELEKQNKELNKRLESALKGNANLVTRIDGLERTMQNLRIELIMAGVLDGN